MCLHSLLKGVHFPVPDTLPGMWSALRYLRDSGRGDSSSLPDTQDSCPLPVLLSSQLQGEQTITEYSAMNKI